MKQKLYDVELSNGQKLKQIGGVDEQDTNEIIKDVIDSLNMFNKEKPIRELSRHCVTQRTIRL